MKFEITDNAIVEKIKKMETDFEEKFGDQNYAFFGQVIMIEGKAVLQFGSFQKEEVDYLNGMVMNRKNFELDGEYENS